jgi:putative tricarboxylic transport membrane protein
VILWHIQGFPAMPGQKFGPAWFPGLIAAALGLCGLWLISAGLRSREAWLQVPAWTGRRRPLAAVTGVIGGLLFYIAAGNKLGFHLTGIALLLLWLRLLGASWRVTIPVALIAPLALHYAFYKLLRIPLPWGVFEPWAF